MSKEDCECCTGYDGYPISEHWRIFNHNPPTQFRGEPIEYLGRVKDRSLKTEHEEGCYLMPHTGSFYVVYKDEKWYQQWGYPADNWIEL